MFGSAALEFAIGMSFVYLMLSLAVTVLQEGIASTLRRRARTLASGINNLLRNDQLVENVYAHPLIRSLHLSDRRPSYIPSRLFVLALLDLLTPKNEAPTIDNVKSALTNGTEETRHVRHALRVLFSETGEDFEKFKTNVEVWFNHGMERVSGWYKRYTQAILLAIAIPLTIAVNADSLLIGQAIWQDPTLRAALVAEAAKVQAQPPLQLTVRGERVEDFVPPPPPQDQPEESLASAATAAEGFVGRLERVKLPIGWRTRSDGTIERWGEALRTHWLGWIITVLAISLGAPFWFDLLNKFMNVREAKAPEEKQKSPKEQQPAMGPGESPKAARGNETKNQDR